MPFQIREEQQAESALAFLTAQAIGRHYAAGEKGK